MNDKWKRYVFNFQKRYGGALGHKNANEDH